MATSIDDILGQIRLPERVYPLCTRPDLRGEWEQAEKDLARAETAARGATLAGGSPTVAQIAERIQQLEAEMEQHTFPIKLQALTHKGWSDLLAAHPPREDHDDDTAYNVDTFGVGLLSACAMDPVMDDEQAGKLIDSLTIGQWNELFNTLWLLNRSGGDIPKSRRASEALLNSQKR